MLTTGSVFLPFVQQHVVDLAGDTAIGTCYIDLRAEVGGKSMIGAGWYDDRYVRTAEGWRIQSRKLTAAILRAPGGRAGRSTIAGSAGDDDLEALAHVDEIDAEVRERVARSPADLSGGVAVVDQYRGDQRRRLGRVRCGPGTAIDTVRGPPSTCSVDGDRREPPGTVLGLADGRQQARRLVEALGR